MRNQDFERLQQLDAALVQMFGVPVDPETAIGRVLAAAAAIGSLQRVARDWANVDYTYDWLNPMVVDAIDRAAEVIGELYEALESQADDVQVMEPGTLVNQQLMDIPTSGAPPQQRPHSAPPSIGPQGVPRGELIR